MGKRGGGRWFTRKQIPNSNPGPLGAQKGTISSSIAPTTPSLHTNTLSRIIILHTVRSIRFHFIYHPFLPCQLPVILEFRQPTQRWFLGISSMMADDAGLHQTTFDPNTTARRGGVNHDMRRSVGRLTNSAARALQRKLENRSAWARSQKKSH